MLHSKLNKLVEAFPGFAHKIENKAVSYGVPGLAKPVETLQWEQCCTGPKSSGLVCLAAKKEHTGAFFALALFRGDMPIRITQKESINAVGFVVTARGDHGAWKMLKLHHTGKILVQ